MPFDTHWITQDTGIGMLLIVFMLGLRHGMDPDHLATIDGITRASSIKRPRLSRWTGLLFSLGHGMMMTAAAGIISGLAHSWQVPVWFEMLGAWISISFLFTLGFTNLYVVLKMPASAVLKPAGITGRLFRPLLARLEHPGWMILIGALFALSFDTLSQVAFFSVSSQAHNGWSASMLFGLVFMLGMIITDGLNGFWVARMIQRTDKLARVASRLLGLIVSGLSLAIGCMTLVHQLFPGFELLVSVTPLQQGISVIMLLLASFALALWLSRS